MERGCVRSSCGPTMRTRKCPIIATVLFLFLVVQVLVIFLYKTSTKTSRKIMNNETSPQIPLSGDKPLFSALPPVLGLNNVSYCSAVKSTDIVVVILSAADNFSRRQFIRKTWAKSLTFSRVLFFVAHSSSLQTTLQLLEERLSYLDILLIDTPDSYHSVSLRLLATFKWIQHHCKNGFIMKVDDDVLINPENYVSSGLVNQLVRNQHLKVVYGKMFREYKPHRSGKYAVSPQDWPFSHGPQFVVGFCYVMTQPALTAILEAYQKSSYYVWLEDVYLTGILLGEGGGNVKQMDVFQGGYVMFLDDVARVVQQSRDRRSKTVNMINVRQKLGGKTFVHIQALDSTRKIGEERVRNWIWEEVWGMEGIMSNISIVNFCIVNC